MIPVLSHIEEGDEFNTWVTTDNRRGFTVQISTLDLEQEDFQNFLSQFRSWVGNLDPRIQIRLNYTNQKSFDDTRCARAETFRHFGYTKSESLLSVEVSGESLIIKEIKSVIGGKKAGSLDRTDELLRKSFLELKDSGFNFRMLNQAEIESHFPQDPKSWVVCDSYLSTGKEYQAVIRLNKPASSEISWSTLDKIKLLLPQPFEISFSFSRLSQSETQMYLRKRIKQAETEADRVGHLRLVANEEALEKTFLEGDSLFNCEFLIILKRQDIRELKKALARAESVLSGFGDAQIETFGSMPSLAASMIGSNQHVSFLETGSNLGFYLPSFESGAASRLLKSSSPHLNIFNTHRENESLGSIEILNTTSLNSNTVIVGASGRGKSGLVGTLTSCLLNDPNVSMIKVDVGGSHSRECHLLSGTEYIINLNNSSGINPFSILKEKDADESVRAILTNFISVLILEEKELSLSKRTKLEIDDCLKAYIESKPQMPSLTDFYLNSINFPRRELLSRWAEGGMYGKAFSIKKSSIHTEGPRLRYYNFSEIFQAADPDFAQAGMAAVLAQFNLEMRLNPHRRLILICDETPFFIQKCFEFFKFSTANVRKFGASVILVVQLSDNLIVNDDNGIIENSYHRFLMSIDGDAKEYQSRFKLTDEQLEKIKGLKSIPRKFSEFFYQCGEKGFKSRLRLSPEEYWRITTTQSEKQKIEKLMQFVPDLSLEEALTCLALKG